ncbi:MAG: response regulator [Lentimicrobium sp.]|nr:response regulator [Lentimicrobium sp.]
MEKKDLIFLVEDNPIFSSTTSKGLEKELGFDVMVFNTGEQLLKYTSEHPDVLPSLVILDFYLNSEDPNAMNGGEVLAKLKDPVNRNNPFRKTPVIMLSSADELSTAVTLLKKGATDYILKDEVFFDNLKKTINTILNIRNYQAEIQLHKGKAENYKKRLLLMGVIIVALLGIVLYLFLK